MVTNTDIPTPRDNNRTPMSERLSFGMSLNSRHHRRRNQLVSSRRTSRGCSTRRGLTQSSFAVTTMIITILSILTTRISTTSPSPKIGGGGVVFVVMALSEDVCIETSPNEDFVCTRQVLETRELYDVDNDETIHVGVTQRVDGNEDEKRAIRDILHQMDMYFFKEVLAFPEYSFARSRCKNSNELCAFWASVGECESNRIFMLTNCPAACRFCLLLHSGLR